MAYGVPGPRITSEPSSARCFNPLCQSGIDLASWCCRDNTDPIVPQMELLRIILLSRSYILYLERLNHKLLKQSFKNHLAIVPWWLSKLRVWHCHYGGTGSIPSLGTSTSHGCSQKKNLAFSRNSVLENWYLIHVPACT